MIVEIIEDVFKFTDFAHVVAGYVLRLEETQFFERLFERLFELNNESVVACLLQAIISNDRLRGMFYATMHDERKKEARGTRNDILIPYSLGELLHLKFKVSILLLRGSICDNFIYYHTGSINPERSRYCI